MVKLLALEPYYGGSHRAFIDAWITHSRHDFALLSLPAHHWKWRMRHASVSFAQALGAPAAQSQREAEPIVWCSSMLNVAELRGLLSALGRHPKFVCYFHENQLAYPNAHPDARDVHFAFDHWTSACAADELWFNSAYDRDTLLEGLARLFTQMPDQRDVFRRAPIEARCRIHPPGIDLAAIERARTSAAAARTSPGTQPLALVWAARWEHDKGPELLLEAMTELAASELDFTLSVLGEAFERVPEAFTRIRERLGPRLLRFGALPKREDYLHQLASSDVFISTAQHEFFGIAAMEAAAAGCRLLVPRALVYPELFADANVYYDGSSHDLVRRLREIDAEPRARWPELRGLAAAYAWPAVARRMDDRIEELLSCARD